jgi:hypothetical protein
MMRRTLPVAVRTTAAVGSLAVCVACAGTSHSGAAGQSGSSPAATSDPTSTTATRLVVTAHRAPWQLPRPVSRVVALPDGSSAILAGGLTTGNVSSSGVYRVNAANGQLHQIGQLASPVHDAAGALIGGSTYVFGGGAQTSTDAIQAVGSSGKGSTVGHLPQPHSDLSSATLGGKVVLLGGYNGTSLIPDIYATTNGTTLKRVGTLPVPVRYGATVSDGSHIWVFGGARGTVPTNAIQRVDPSGHAQVVGHLPQALTEATALDVGHTLLVAGGKTSSGQTNGVVYAFDPATARVTKVAQLPVPVADSGGVVIGGTGYLIGGESSTQLRTVQEVKVAHVSTTASATPTPSTSTSTSASTSAAQPPPFVGKLLIADRGNNRLLLVDAQKHILWRFPTATKPAPPTGFYVPDDAFFIHGGTGIISNQEGNDTIVEVGYPSGKPLWSYGHPHTPGTGPGYLHEPDDAYLLKDGRVVVADANNCRIVIISPQRQQVGQIGDGACVHNPPHSLGYPNGDTPLRDGNILISEVYGSWISEYTLTGHLVWTVQLPQVSYPSDPQQIGPNRYLVADYAKPGGLFEFDRQGHILWRYQPPNGPGMLNHPSLAEVLPNGLIGVNDDYRHRMVIIDPKTKQIVWQYGHTSVKGRAPGYLNTPDGFDLLAPNNTTPTHPFTG